MTSNRLRNILASLLLVASLAPAMTASAAPSATPAPVITQTGKTDPVYATPHGKKFHIATCKSMKGKGVSMSRADAEKKGLTACKICKP